MAVVIASAHLTDDDFLYAFDSGNLPLACFRHGDHLRLAWIHLHREPLDQALERVRCGIQKYAARHGVAHVYHETITAAWVKLLATHRETSFAEFVQTNEQRLTLALLHQFWTPAALDSQRARTDWLPPDRESLPQRLLRGG